MHRHRVLGVHQVHVAAGRAALHGTHRHPQRVLERVEQHHHVDELAGVEPLVGVLEVRAQHHRPGRGVDLGIDRLQLPGGELRHIGPVESGNREHRAGMDARHDLRQAVLRYRKLHRRRIEHRQHHDAAGGAGLHVIAGIDLPQTDAPVRRRDDVAIGQVELLRLDLRLVVIDRALVLFDGPHLVLIGLPGDRLLVGERSVALEVHLRLFERRFVAGELRPVLFQGHFVRPRIDQRQQLSLLDQLPLLEPDAHQITVDLGGDGNGRERRYRAERAQRQADIAPLDDGDPHRLIAAVLKSTATRRRLRYERDRPIDDDRDDRNAGANRDPQNEPASRGTLGIGALEFHARMISRAPPVCPRAREKKY